MTLHADTFANHLDNWLASACEAGGYELPGEEFIKTILLRLTAETTDWLSAGLEQGIIVEQGHFFNLSGNGPGKGPYRWFSRNSGAPRCNWEYFVQVALYGRLYKPCQKAGLSLTFEDGLMDLAVRDAGHLIWCIEVKEQPRQLTALLSFVAEYGRQGVDLQTPDRGNDGLRKAKYLIRHRPEFFTGVAVGVQKDYQVSYYGEGNFSLEPTTPPIALAVT